MVLARLGALAFLIAPALTGCTSWTHQQKGSGQFTRDNAVCEREALERVQPSYHQQQYTRKAKSQSYTIDASDSLRDRWRRNCLERGGWTMHVKMPWSDAADAVPRSTEQRPTNRR